MPESWTHQSMPWTPVAPIVPTIATSGSSRPQRSFSSKRWSRISVSSWISTSASIRGSSAASSMISL